MKKIFSYICTFIFAVLLISGCSCKKDKDNGKASLGVGDMNIANYVDINWDEYDSKIRNKDSFIFFVYSSSCSACKAFKPKLASVIQEKHIYVYGIDLDSNSNNHKILKTIEYTPTIIIYKEGTKVFQTISDNDYKYLDTKESFVELLEKYTNMPTLYYINKTQLKEKITNKENFIIYYSRSSCGDCNYLNKNYMKEYLRSNYNSKTFYIIETDAEGIRYNGKVVDQEQWQSFKDEFGLSNTINKTYGHGAGYVPTLQYYENGEIKDMMVYFNDFNEGVENADGSYSVTIDNSYYADNPYINQTLDYSEYQTKLAPFYNSKLKTFLDTNLAKVN